MQKPLSSFRAHQIKCALTAGLSRLFATTLKQLKWARRARQKAASDGLVSKRRYLRWKEVAVFQDEIDVVKQRESSQMIDKASIRLPE